MKNFLYDPTILSGVDFSSSDFSNSKISLLNGSSSYTIRPLSVADYEAGYIQLLSQLTVVGDVSQEQFLERFNEMKALKSTYYVTVIEDKNTGEVVGTGTLFIERKFIHGCALRGRLEDIVVSDKHRGQQLGKLIVTTLTSLAKKINCYKVTLDCTDKMRPFYESSGYSKEEGNSNFMQLRFKPKVKL